MKNLNKISSNKVRENQVLSSRVAKTQQPEAKESFVPNICANPA